MNGIMNSIVSSDGEYQSIIRGSDVYSSGRLKQMKLPEEVRLLIVLRPQGFVNKYSAVFSVHSLVCSNKPKYIKADI